jgi:hypothetical protein
VKIATWKVAPSIAGKSADGEFVRARFFSGVPNIAQTRSRFKRLRAKNLPTSTSIKHTL